MQINGELQMLLFEAVEYDPYGLSPQTLLNNIIGSLKAGTPPSEVQKIYEISDRLLEVIIEHMVDDQINKTGE